MKQSLSDDIASLPVQKVGCELIDSTDSTYRITTESSLDELCRSIRTVGLLSPPILEKTGPAYRVVSGFRRVAAWRRLHGTQIPAQVLGAQTPQVVIASLAVADNTSLRALNLIEQSRAIRLMASVLPPDGNLGELLGRVGLSSNPSLTQKISLLAGFPAVIQEGVLAGTLSLGMAVELGGMPNEDGMLLAKLFAELKPSLNKQREIITLATEIALRDGVDLANLFSSEPLAGLCGAEEMDRNRKIREIRTLLRQKRYPELSRAEERVTEAIGHLNLGPGLNLIPPRHFESPTWNLTLAFDSKAALRKAHAELTKLLDDPALTRILEKRSD